jgi:hypothetical protein
MLKPSAATVLETARNRRRALGGRHELHGTIHAYCPNVDCSVREVKLFVKEYDVRMPDPLICPACRQTLDLHRVES